jgi:3-carboxy-cis,cis-muconate cycloisomerase
MWSWAAQVGRWLEVEAALARACADVGLVDRAHADAVASVCTLPSVDLERLAAETSAASTPIIPLLRQLTDGLPVEASSALHHGATSQDILDTAAMLGIRSACSIIEEDLRGMGRRLAELADQERDTVMAGRTLLQQAVPITFGLKAARWLHAVDRHLDRLRSLSFPAQLGGAAGTLAAYGEQGIDVAGRFASLLELCDATLPWHAEREILHEIVSAVTAVSGTCGRISGDLLLLAQTEVAEVVDGRAGGSSTMPHKRNLADATFAVASARLAEASAASILTGAAMGHERSAGSWQAEWVAIPRTLEAAAVAVERTRRTLEHLRLDREQMRDNLAQTYAAEPLAQALSVALGRAPARAVVDELVDLAARGHADLLELARRDARVTAAIAPQTLDDLGDPYGYLGSTSALIDRALQRWRQEKP